MERQTPLPAAGDGMPTTIVLPRDHTKINPTKTAMPLPSISQKKADHPLIKQCRSHFKGATKNGYGRLVSSNRSDVDVSRASFPRALSILNVLVNTAEAHGHSCAYSSQHNAIELTIRSEQIRLSIAEKSTRTERALTAKQQQHKARYGYMLGKRWDYEPTGKLTLTLVGHRLYGTRTVWSDKKRGLLEDDLPIVFAGILSCVEHLAALRVEDKERAHRYAIRQLRAQRLKHASELQQKRIESVEKLVTGLERATAIRACLTEIQTRTGMTCTKTQRLHRWAEQLARHYDPTDEYTLPQHLEVQDITPSWSL